MSTPSLYQITLREVDPLSALMKSIVELNWNASRARNAGWAIKLTIDDNTLDVNVSASRDEWPCPDSEAEGES